MKIDVVLTSGPPDVRALVGELVEAGADGVASIEGPHDAFVPLVQAAAADIDIASYVAIAFPRSPVHLAHVAWDLQTLSGGRFRLGLGTQVRAHVERRYGSDFDQPVDRMREWVEAIRAVFARWQDGTPLHFDGRHTAHTLMPPLFSPPPLPDGPPPILVGALGPRLLAMTTAVADGVVLHPMTTQAYLLDMVERRIPAGLAEAGRDPAGFEVVAGALVGVHDGSNEGEVRDGLRGLVAFYASTPAYRPVLETIGAGPLQEELRSLTRENRWDDLAAVVDDGLLDQLCTIGPPAEVGRRLRTVYGGRTDRLSLTFVQPLPPVGLADVLDAVREPTA